MPETMAPTKRPRDALVMGLFDCVGSADSVEEVVGVVEDETEVGGGVVEDVEGIIVKDEEDNEDEDVEDEDVEEVETEEVGNDVVNEGVAVVIVGGIAVGDDGWKVEVA
jgi:hypothetical protein